MLLLGVAHVHDRIADRAAALAFGTRHNEHYLEAFRTGKRALTFSAYEIQVERLEAASIGARKSATSVLWLLVAGALGYLMLSREPWRFRASAFAVLVVFEIGLSMFGSVY